MGTTRELIRRSFNLLGVLSEGESPTNQMTADAVSALSDLMDSFSTQGLTVNSRVREEFTLTAAQQTYTLGSGGDFDTTRPQEIIGATIEVQDGTSYPEIPVKILTLDEWAAIQIKNTQSSIPQRLYCDWAFPLANVNLYPIPDTANKLVLYTWKALTSLAVDDTISLPQGYNRMLRYNLAVELAPEYDMEASPSIMKIADESLGNIKRKNMKPVLMACDPALTERNQSFDYLIGE